MKRGVKKGIIVASAVVLAALTIAANIIRSHSQVHAIDVDIHCVQTPKLVDESTVADSILANIPQLFATRVGDVDRERVAAAAMKVPFIEEASASVSVSGKVVVKTKQRRPIARLYYGRNEYYMDSKNTVFPTSKIGDCDVLVAGGNFVEPLRLDSINHQVKELLALAYYLDRHSSYAMLVDQIYIESDNDIMMVSKLGDNIIELGNTEDLDSKFGNLWTFYRKGMPRARWETYKKISLKYKGQVVCTKDKK